MGKKANGSHQSFAASELLNFRFASSPAQQQQQHDAQSNRRSGGRNRTHDQRRYQRSEQDRTSARRKASSQMFHLHSSAYHSFSLTRKSKMGYAFQGCDAAVSWEDVKTVKYLAPATESCTMTGSQETCPICLDTFTCARITKCGHCFCLACLMRHNHTNTAENVAAGVKCPCCGLQIHFDDIRPVVIESVLTPRVQTTMKLVKLHRTKDCPAPYLPRNGEWKRSAPTAIPSMTDRDAKFSRFTYVDPVAYQGLLSANLADLGRNARDLRHGPDLELLFVQMSQERVKNELNGALQDAPDEQAMMNRFSQSQAGFYQCIPECLFGHGHQNCNESSATDEVLTGVASFEGSCSVTSRFREISFGSDGDYQRSRAESVGSEENSSRRLGRAHRGYSIDSYDSVNTPKTQNQRSESILPTLPASLYLEEQASQFYQSADGQLCFLSKFNMNCLTSDFTIYPPVHPMPVNTSPNECRRLRPLPDEIEGIVQEVESLQLTPEMRKRVPVFSHLPFYTDILFVELDLNRILSRETKQMFKNEFEKRKLRRKNKAVAEKHAEQLQERKEQERIDELKSRMQRFDPTDDFFCVEPNTVTMTGDQFGPSIGAVDAVRSPTLRPTTDPALNFSAIVTTPSSIAMSQDAFPSLTGGGSQNLTGATSVPIPTPSWARGWHEANYTPKIVESTDALAPPLAQGSGSSKKSKNKEKIVLFSTGGQRGG